MQIHRGYRFPPASFCHPQHRLMLRLGGVVLSNDTSGIECDVFLWLMGGGDARGVSVLGGGGITPCLREEEDQDRACTCMSTHTYILTIHGLSVFSHCLCWVYVCLISVVTMELEDQISSTVWDDKNRPDWGLDRSPILHFHLLTQHWRLTQRLTWELRSGVVCM